MTRLLLLVALLLPAGAHAQTATLTGHVATAQGAPLEGVSVFVPGTLAATFTDADGAYRLDDVDVGDVEIHAQFAGYRTEVARVTLADGEALTLDFVLRRRPFWERALLFSTDPDAEASRAVFAVPRTLETEALPARRTDEVAGLLPGLIRDERSDTLTFLHGPRVARSLDGVPLPAPLPLPWDAVGTLALYGEHTPAHLAGGRDATLDVTTRDGTEGRILHVEGLGAPLSPTGLAEVRAAVGTPLLGQRFRFFAAASVARQADPRPSAVDVARLTPAARAALQASPQRVIAVREDDPDTRLYLPFPTDLPPTLTLDELRERLDLPPGYVLDPSQGLFIDAPQVLEGRDLTSGTRQHARAEERRLFVRTGLTLAGLDADLTYADAFDGFDVWNAAYALFNDDAFGRTETRQRYLRLALGYGLGPFDLRFTAAAYRDRVVTFDPDFSSDIEATLRYGVLGAPGNEVAARYRFRRSDGTIVSQYGDGILPSTTGVAGLYARPGAPGPDYAQGETDASVLRLENASTWGPHDFVLGVEQQQRAERAITIDTPSRLIYYTTSGEFEGVETYADLPYLPDRFAYYGYDYLGLRRADAERLHAFTTGTDRALAPFEVTRTDLYAADRFTLGPLSADLGVRYALFSHNRPRLADPYALLPIVRAGDANLASERIGRDYAVYYNGTDVVGFRSPEGAFLDAYGQPAEGQDIAGRGRVRGTSSNFGLLDETAFRDARTRGVWQPRVALNLAVASGASVWLSYDRTADLPPDAWMNATLQQYQRNLQQAGFVANADLQPEVAATYAVGATLRYDALTTTLSFAQRDLLDLAVPLSRKNVFPNNYTTYVSEGRGRIRSGTLQVEADRTNGLALQAAYTLSSSTRSLAAHATTPIFWLREANPYLPDVEQTRHVVRGLLDYQSDAASGPRVGAFHPFARLRAVLAVEAQSGQTYGRILSPHALSDTQGLSGFGGWRTQPWQVLVHARVARDLTLKGRTLTVFAEARNLLDRDNVRRVYPATGRADDDGYLDTADGRASFPPASIARQYYRARLADPDFYGLPREIRLGLRLAL